MLFIGNIKSINMKTCEDCGCKVYSSKCVNCDEELFIIDQYQEQDMVLPAGESEFMKKAVQSLIKINDRIK